MTFLPNNSNKKKVEIDESALAELKEAQASYGIEASVKPQENVSIETIEKNLKELKVRLKSQKDEHALELGYLGRFFGGSAENYLIFIFIVITSLFFITGIIAMFKYDEQEAIVWWQKVVMPGMGVSGGSGVVITIIGAFIKKIKKKN